MYDAHACYMHRKNTDAVPFTNQWHLILGLIWALENGWGKASIPFQVTMVHYSVTMLQKCASICASTSSKLEKSDGTRYPPDTIRSLKGGVNCQLQINKASFSLFDKANPQCQDLCNALNVVCSNLNKDDYGADKHSAPVEHEKWFRDLGVLGYGSPKALQNAVCWVTFYIKRSARVIWIDTSTICSFYSKCGYIQ